MALSKAFRVIIILALLIAVIPIAGCHQQEPEQEPGSQQYDTISLSHGGSDIRFFDLAKDQTLTVQFHISPKDAEIVVIIGSVVKSGYTDWRWAYRHKEWPHINNGSKIKFEAPSTYSYAMWMQPRLTQTVEVTIGYWFSD